MDQTGIVSPELIPRYMVVLESCHPGNREPRSCLRPVADQNGLLYETTFTSSVKNACMELPHFRLPYGGMFFSLHLFHTSAAWTGVKFATFLFPICAICLSPNPGASRR